MTATITPRLPVFERGLLELAGATRAMTAAVARQNRLRRGRRR